MNYNYNELGFFGVCPGTSEQTNPIGLKIIQYNTIFTNVAHTTDGKVYWEGLDDNMVSHGEHLISWEGKDWTKDSNEPAAHPNSRFCSPAENCPTIDPQWQNPNGVPISALIFGGRRPKGVPLVMESFNWNHGVFIASAEKSEATTAAEYKSKVVMHDPFSMRPFFGYNFGNYLKHWLSLNKDGRKMPKIFHVNWFRKSKDGEGSYLWPGFGENLRVLEWIFKRTEDKPSVDAVTTPVGLLPHLNDINISGLDLSQNDLEELFRLDKKFWIDEAVEIKQYFDEYVNDSTPKEIYDEVNNLKKRVEEM